MKRNVVLAALIASLLTAAPAASRTDASSGQSAGAFLVEASWAGVRAQYGKVWSKLHPRYQRVTTRAFWESCQRKEAKDTAGLEVHSLTAIEEHPDIVTLPLLGKLKVRAVTMEMRYSHPLLGNNKKLTDTVYAVKWGTTWKGLWKPESYAAYAKRRCPA